MEREPIPSVVLITGASSGIGRSVALKLAQRGCRIGLLSRDANSLVAVEEEVRRSGGEGLALVADVSRPTQVERAIHVVVERWGRLDGLVNNAGYLVHGSVEDCTLEDFEQQVAVNYLGAVYCTKFALPYMQKQHFGSIIFVSSISARIYVPLNAAYQASKAALRAFALTLRAELWGSNISVSLISPGRTRTSIVAHSIERTSQPGRFLLAEMPVERVAQAIVDCMGSPRREIMIPLGLRGLLLVYTIAPSLIERWLPRLQTACARLAR